jgi:phosphatidylserine decarboxylase
MKALKKSLAVGLLSCFALVGPSLTDAWAASADKATMTTADAEPVNQLRALYASNAEFKKTMDEALANVQAQPDGSANPWKGKTFSDLCDFFNKWYYLLPVNNSPTSDEFVYVIEFSWFYYKNPAAQKIVGQEPGLSWTKDFVAARGKFMDSPASTETIPQWIKDPSIQIDQYVVPEGGFKSFNEFFTRNLKPGTRTIASPTDDLVLSAPTDCVLNMIQPIATADTLIKTKLNQAFNVKQLLNNSPHADRFVGGNAVSCILLPATYHHYHAVASGTVVESNEDIAGSYWGIPDFPTFFNNGNVGYGASYSAFEHFRRGYAIIDTPKFGLIAMVPVGLDTIGSVVFEEPFKKVAADGKAPVQKGDKIGHFAYGGSMVIMLFEAGVVSGVKVMQGQQIGIMSPKK